MSRKNLTKYITILCISIFITFLLYKFIPQKLQNFVWEKQKIVSSFIMIVILTTLIYNTCSGQHFQIFTTQLLVWGIIFLVIIIGYAFRFEITYIKQRVISVLLPSYQWVNKEGELVISRSNDGHFYIDAYVNGIKIKFMIDTGASDVAITPQDAKKLKYDLSKLDYSKTYSTANGTSKAAPIKLENIVIGTASFRNIDAHIGTEGLDISLLGMSVLERFRSFRIERDLLILNY